MSSEARLAPARRLLLALRPWAALAECWRHRDLIIQFTRREVEGRYRGSYLGIAWSLATPLLMLGVYTFVFGIIFKARWPHERGGDTIAQFALVVFAGVVAFQVFAEPATRAAGIITAVPNFVKKIVFPLSVLPAAVVGAATIHSAIALAVLAVGSLCVHGSVPWTLLLMPLALVPLVLLALGTAWFLSALGVYVKDVGFVSGVVVQCLFFLSPIFYPVTSVPEPFQTLVRWNPLAANIEMVRALAVRGVLPPAADVLVAFAVGISALVLGHAWFTLTRKGFADVL